MKNTIKIFAALAASLLAFSACQQEINTVDPSETHSLSFIAEAPQTKTSVSKENGEAVYSWSSGDENRFSVYEIVEGSYSEATSVEALEEEGQMMITAKFSGAAHAGAQYLALFNTGVQASQGATDTSYDQLSDVLISEVVTSSDIENKTLVLCFKRETAFALMTAKGLEGNYMIGASVSADKVLATDYDYKTKAFEATGSKTITIDALSEVTSGESPIFFATVPVEDAALKVAVVTGDENGDFQAAYEKSFAAGKSISFTRGDVHAFGMTFGETCKVEKVTLNLNANNTTTCTADEISWVESFVSVVNVPGEGGTNANNFCPPSQSSTRFYKNSELTITPNLGVSIKKVTFTATTTGYADALKKSDWSSNAFISVDGTSVTVIPLDGNNLTATIGDTCGFTKIEIELGTPDVVHPSSVSLSETSLSLNVEDTHTLLATILPTEAINKTVTWSSSAEDVATVTNGVVRAMAPGNATITVTTVDGGVSASCEVTVSSGGAGLYKWVKVTTLADLENNGRYYLATNDGKKIFNGTKDNNNHLLVGTTEAVYGNGKLTIIPEDAKVITLAATSTANQYYIMFDGNYLHATAAKSGSFSFVSNSDFDGAKHNAWTFSVSDGKFDAVGSIVTAKIRSYNNGGFRSYASNATSGDSFVLYKRVSDLPTCAAPTLTSGTDGEVNIGTVIYLTNNEAGSTIRYTVDGSDPTPSSTEYTAAGITINDDCTIKAAAFKANYNASPVLTLNYTVPVVATPTIEVNEGTGEATITCETDGATILYTVGDGEPDAVYNADDKPVLSSGQTIKSKASKVGYKDSAVASKKFVVRALDRIAWTGYTVNYFVGDTFKKDGTVTAYYNDSTSEVVTEADGVEFSSPNMSTAADNVSVTVSFNGKSTTGTINVKPKSLTVGYTFKAASLGSGYGTKTSVAKDAASNVTWTVTYGQGSYVGTNSSNKSNCKLGSTYAKVGTPAGYNANTTQVAAIISESKLDGVAKVVVSGDTDSYNPQKISLVYSTDGNTYSLIETQEYSKANGNTFTFAAKSEGFYALVLYYTGNSYMRTNNLKAEFYK